MIYQEASPCPELAQYIKCYWFLSSSGLPAPSEQAILPDGCMEMVLNRGDRFHRAAGGLWERQPLSIIVGQTLGPVVVAATGTVDLLGIRFHPWGARAFIDEPLVWLRGRIPALDDVSTRLSRLVIDHDGELRDRGIPETVAALDRMMLRAMRRRSGLGDAVEHAARMITLAEGAVSVSDVAKWINLTGRQLERRFIEEIGISPKRLARILRFQNALAMSRRQQTPNWAGIAAECGYFDQTHMARDFREFGGGNPASLELDPASLTALAVAAQASEH